MNRHVFALDADRVARAFRSACRLDVTAFKPGNVSVAAPGHGMRAEDFLVSAEAAARALCTPGLLVGARIAQAIEATRGVVPCNTNLGIVLLTAPLAQAALAPSAVPELRGRLQTVLAALTIRDAEHAYRAIRLASPGGLGRAEHHDVSEEPQVTLLEAMREAAGRDRIAQQYASGFQDVFDVGLPAARAALGRGAGPERSVVETYLTFLARFPDSHIVRKYGGAVAQAVCLEAAGWLDRLCRARATEQAQAVLAEADARLKSQSLNPGTSADLTVAAWLALALEELLQAEYHSTWAAPAAGHR
ncbi:MAG TPA: triphosphoribosyl-dephospho-CoA synthase [Burkholderiales bacterium]|nr:triphosphoribosyl-dephospho-CoA synthase [Burkholderiales bacterium]